MEWVLLGTTERHGKPRRKSRGFGGERTEMMAGDRYSGHVHCRFVFDDLEGGAVPEVHVDAAERLILERSMIMVLLEGSFHFSTKR
jgi:hypothetical protein